MPLETIIQPDAHTKILVWHITEPLAELSVGVQLRPASQARVQGMSSELHQRGFLSVRQMMLTQGYQDTDLFYDITGKPHLTDGKHISISHSHERAAVAISNRAVGIDLEIQREKILRIADRFNDNCNLSVHDPALYMRELTVIWGFKEAIFKIRNEPGISFVNHIFVEPFDIESEKATAQLHFGGTVCKYAGAFKEIADYTLVYIFDDEHTL